MLASYLKNNKSVYKKFKKHHGKADDSGDEKVGKKRKRKASVADSEAESSKKSKRPRLSSVASEASKGPVTRRKSMDANENG